jgi:VWFA-related protein
MRLAQPDVSGFPRVQLFVYATGANGQPIAGAGAGEFEILENGELISGATVRDATQGTPVEVCLAIDRSGSMLDESKLRSAQVAAAQFLRSLRPDDRAGLISFADHATLDRSLTRDTEGVAQAVNALQPYGGTAVYDAVYWAVNQVALAPQTLGSVVTRPARSGARRVVLALTDGDDNRSATLPERVIRFARDNGVTIYTIGLGSDARASELERLAQGTGGQYFAAPGPSALAQLYALIARQLQSEYTLAYDSPRPEADGTRREVTVRLSAAAESLSAAGWYQAPGGGSSVISMARPATPGATGPSVAGGQASPMGRGGHRVILAFLAIVAALGAGTLVYLFWLAHTGSRAAEAPLEEPLPPAQPAERTVMHTNPRIDLRPLCVRAPVTEVGRAEENDLVIDSPLVSRRHARIERIEGEYRLVDVGSANGTFLNGERVTEAPITVGDVVRFADQEFEFAGEQAT